MGQDHADALIHAADGLIGFPRLGAGSSTYVSAS
jgi:hypothetical protein